MPRILTIHISARHNYFGHHGKQPGAAPMTTIPEARCVAGRGIEGDRFFDWKDDYKGQVTFFAQEVHEILCERLQVYGTQADVFRRNVITRGIDLNALIGRRFRLQGVLFEGSEEAKPCYWMNQAFAEGAERELAGRGGLRARVIEDGILRPGEAALEIITNPAGA